MPLQVLKEVKMWGEGLLKVLGFYKNKYNSYKKKNIRKA